MSNYSIKLNLLKLKDSFATNIKGKTDTKRCVVIPIDDNHLFVGEKGVYLNISAIALDKPQYDSTHFVKQNISKEVYEKMSEEQRKTLPILGDLKPIVAKAVKVEGVSDFASSAEQPDDLPF